MTKTFNFRLTSIPFRRYFTLSPGHPNRISVREIITHAAYPVAKPTVSAYTDRFI